MPAYGVPIEDQQGNLLEWIGAHSDITEQKQAERALKQAIVAAEAANRAKSEFLANMSHEIRTPMNGVIGLTELAFETELTEEQHQYLEGIASSGNTLLQVINDILDFSKIEAGKLDIDQVNFELNSAVELAVETMAVRAHEKRLERLCDVHPDVPDGVIGDPTLDVHMPDMDGFTLLEQIHLEPELDRPAILMLSSLDRGKEIARARELGAAAYLVKPVNWKKLQAAIGEALAIGDGKTAKRERAVSRQSTPEPTVGPLRILVAEDNAVNQLFVVRTLGKAGHEAIVAGNGRATLELLERGHFDVVLMDGQMPVLDGDQATDRIREREQGTGRHQPIIAMTAHAMKGDREHCLKMGMDSYVSKPINSHLLFQAIDEVLNLRKPEGPLDVNPDAPPVPATLSDPEEYC